MRKKLSLFMVGFLGLMVCAFASTFGLKGTAYHWEVATSISAGDVMVLAVDNGTVAKELSGISGTATPYGTCADYTGTPAGTFALEVEAGSESGTFSFKSSGGYLSWSEGNSLTVSETKNANSSWKVTITDGVASIVNAVDETRKLMYNAGNPRFACYTSAQKDVTLWKKVAGEPPVTTGEYYVVGPEDFFGVAWAIDAENKMTASAGASGVFTKTYQGVEITASEAAPYTLLYKFLSADGRWFPAGTNNDMNYVFKQSGIYDITFKLDVEKYSDANPYEPQNITVTLKEAVVGNIAALNKLSKDVEFTLTGDVLVVAKPTAKYVFIKDDTGSSLIYDNSGASTEEMAVGKTIAGGWQGKVSIYNGLFEAVPVEAPVMSDAPVVTVTYPEVAPEYVSDQHINEVVTLKGVHYSKPDGKNFNITVDGVDIVVPGYNQFGLTIADPDESKTYDMVGAIGIYSKNNKTTIQFQPIEITEAVAEPIVWPAGLEGEDWKITTTAKPIVGDDVEVKDEACKVGFVTDDNVVYIQAELTALGQTVTATMKGIRDGDNNVILPKGQIVAQGTYMGQSISGYLFGPNASDAVLTYTETAEKTSLTNAGPIYLNVSPDGAGTNLFTLTNTEIYKAAETPTTMDYYVAGSMTQWKPVAANKMTLNTAATGEEYMLTLELKANDEFKVAKSDGQTILDVNWYPQSPGNYTITQDGKYTIYFRPNADGGQDWYGGCIFVAMEEEPVGPVVWPAGLEGEDWQITTTAKTPMGTEGVRDEPCKLGFVTDNNEVYIQGELNAMGTMVTATLKGVRDANNNVTIPKGQLIAQGTYMNQDVSGYIFAQDATGALTDVVLTYSKTNDEESLTNAGPVIVNTSSDGSGISVFTLTNTKIFKKLDAPTAMDYYVAGSMTQWKPVAANKMTLNTAATGEEYMLTLELKANDEFKVAKSDGQTIDDTNWYPQSPGNYTITQDGKYTIYFRPNADGGQDWYGGCIFVAMEEEPVGPVVWPAGLEGETWKINTTAQKGNSTPETIEGQDCKVGIIASDAVAYLQLNLTIQNVPVTVTVKGTIGNNNTTVTIPNGQMVAQETVSGQVLSAYLFGANGTDVVMTYSKTAEKESLTYAGTIALSLTADGTQPVYTLTNTEVYKELDTPTLEKFYIIGDQDGWSNTEEKPNLKEMTWNAETGAFEYSVTVEKDFFFAFGDVATADSWDDFNANHRYGVRDAEAVEAVEGQTLQLKKTTGDASVKITALGVYTVSVTKDLVLSIVKTGEVTPPADHTYIVAGDPNTIFGSSWDGTNEDNKMEKQADGTYQKTYTVDQAYDGVQLKVVEDGETWHGDANGNNVSFNLTGAGTFTVTIDPTTHVVTVTGEIVKFPTELDYTSVYAVGNGNGNWLNGVGWNPGAAANKMTEVSDDVWEITFKDVPATNELQVKFAIDGAWTYNFGGTFAAFGQETDAVWDGGNITFTTTEATDITVRLDLTNFNFLTKEGAKFTITLGTEPPVEEATYLVAGSSEALFGSTWNTETDANNLTADATTGLYSKSWSKVALEAGDIEYKIVKKTATATTWIPDGDNQKYTIDEAGDYDVVVTFNPTTKEAVMTATKIYTPTLEGEAIYWTDGDVATAGNTAATYGTSTFQLSITDTNGKVAIDANTAYFGDATSQVMFTHRLKTGGASSSKNAMKLTIGSAGKLRLYVRTGSNGATDRNLVLKQNGTEIYNQVVKEADAVEVAESDLNVKAPALEEPVMKKVYPIIEVEVAAGEVEITYPTNSLNFYCMQLIAGTTGISNIEVEQPMFDETKPAYNLKGERVTKSYRGMIIQNGRKFMNK